MSRIAEPDVAAPHDWVSFARELAGAGWWADAVTAYERALTGLGATVAGVDPGTGAGTGAGGWQVRLLGGFAISDGAGTVVLDGLRPQHRELLQVLCIHADRAVPDRQLCAWFWPDADPDRARHRLAVGISAVRSLPAAPAVDRVTGGYRLRIDAGDTDVRRFDRLLAAARTAVPPQRVSLLQEVLAAYAGPLLPGAGSSEWVLTERDRLRDAAVDAAAELADRHARDGRHRDVVRVARAGLRIDRQHDRLWRRLVTALTALREPAAAAVARRQYTAVLVGLGVDGARSSAPGRASA